MDLSQSQQGAAAAAEEPGLPRKLARARMPSPPCARNIFTDGPEEEPDVATMLTRRPPYVSRYRSILSRCVMMTNLMFTLRMQLSACQPRTAVRLLVAVTWRVSEIAYLLAEGELAAACA